MIDRAGVFKRLECTGRWKGYPIFILQDISLVPLSTFFIFLRLHPHSIQDGGLQSSKREGTSSPRAGAFNAGLERCLGSCMYFHHLCKSYRPIYAVLPVT